MSHFENLTKDEIEEIEVYELLEESVLKVSMQLYSDNIELDIKYGYVCKSENNCKNSIDNRCRMRTCICNEEGDEWYGETCDNCDEYIDKSDALRIPLLEGGWFGCFCSISCIREIYKDVDDDQVPIKQILINALEYKLDEIPMDYFEE